MEREVRFPYFTHTGKILTSVDYYRLCIYDIIPRVTTKNGIQKDACKNTVHESSNGISKTVQVTYRKSGQRK